MVPSLFVQRTLTRKDCGRIQFPGAVSPQAFLSKCCGTKKLNRWTVLLLTSIILYWSHSLSVTINPALHCWPRPAYQDPLCGNSDGKVTENGTSNSLKIKIKSFGWWRIFILLQCKRVRIRQSFLQTACATEGTSNSGIQEITGSSQTRHNWNYPRRQS